MPTNTLTVPRRTLASALNSVIPAMSTPAQGVERLEAMQFEFAPPLAPQSGQDRGRLSLRATNRFMLSEYTFGTPGEGAPAVLAGAVVTNERVDLARKSILVVRDFLKAHKAAATAVTITVTTSSGTDTDTSGKVEFALLAEKDGHLAALPDVEPLRVTSLPPEQTPYLGRLFPDYAGRESEIGLGGPLGLNLTYLAKTVEMAKAAAPPGPPVPLVIQGDRERISVGVLFTFREMPHWRALIMPFRM